MRRQHDIRQKRKELLNKRLGAEVQEKLRVCPKNCKFNQLVDLDNSGFKISLCTFGQHSPDAGMPVDVSKLIVCNSSQQARECNARIPIFSGEEEARASLAEELKDINNKITKYPEILILDWVLDDELHQAKANPSSGLQKLFLKLASFFENLSRRK